MQLLMRGIWAGPGNQHSQPAPMRCCRCWITDLTSNSKDLHIISSAAKDKRPMVQPASPVVLKKFHPQLFFHSVRLTQFWYAFDLLILDKRE